MTFVDTDAFLARYVAADQHHRAAQRTWKKLGRTKQRLFTSSFVLDELVTLLGRRAGHAFAAERARRIYASPRLEILRPTRAGELAALDLFERYAASQVSFTDCVSFALMKQARIRRAFTFDRHFVLAGFDTIG
ncbi:MAG: PIN domain-containing protein [Deltaproteobacteria bacterium]|nr:PIN domain-containing protein [Deltaproteobacteria bacterium]